MNRGLLTIVMVLLLCGPAGCAQQQPIGERELALSSPDGGATAAPSTVPYGTRCICWPNAAENGGSECASAAECGPELECFKSGARGICGASEHRAPAPPGDVIPSGTQCCCGSCT